MPWLVRYARQAPTLVDRAELRRRHGMWRYRAFLPLAPGEEPVSLGEGDTPLLPVERTAHRLGVRDLWVKDEGANPTGSFKSRGLSAAITRAVAGGAEQFVLPTAGNAGVAAAAYGARAGRSVRVYAPQSTPATILSQIRAFGGDLVLIDGHIGDCGRASRAYAAETGAMDLSTLREPYRIEGKKTLGLELAMRAPDGKGLKVYGSGLLSSHGEIAHSVDSPLIQRYPVQLEWVVNQYFEIDHYQPLLFIVESFDHLFELVGELERWMREGRLDNVSPGEPLVSEPDLRSFLEASRAK